MVISNQKRGICRLIPKPIHNQEVSKSRHQSKATITSTKENPKASGKKRKVRFLFISYNGSIYKVFQVSDHLDVIDLMIWKKKSITKRDKKKHNREESK